MITIFLILAVSALISCIISIMGKCPLYVPVLLLAIIEVMRCLPLH